VCKILIGNKCDKEGDRKINFEQGADLAKQYEMPFLEASAKSAYNVEQVFTTITRAISEKFAKMQAAQTNYSAKLKKGSSLEHNSSTGGCC